MPYSDPTVTPSMMTPVQCPRCHHLLDTCVVVNPAGELLGCEDCATEQGLAGENLTLAEWYAPDAVQEVLQFYGLTDPIAGKPDVSSGHRPCLHYWVVQSNKRVYFLKRFHEWYPEDSVRYVHSILEYLAEDNLAAPRVIANRAGASFTEVGGAVWALYRAIDGRAASERDWMWGRPKAAEMLATLHQALDGFTPAGQSFEPWNAWTVETVDDVLENWPAHPELNPDVLGYVRDRLATRYFGELYPELPKLIVHGDYLVSNVLWRGESTSAAISGVLDFERAHEDTALFDFAWGLGDRRPPLLRATVAAYSRRRPLSGVEREALPEALLLGGLMAIDMKMMYFQDMSAVARLGQDLTLMVRDLEALRKAVTAKSA